MKNKKAAIELSMTTIVVVVLSLSLLILGFVLIRSIMCGAIGFTGEINNKVEKEVQRLFDNSNEEISCIGGGEPVSIAPSGISNVYCSINSKTGSEYRIRVTDILPLDYPRNVDLESWITIGNWDQTVAPNDRNPKKVATLNIPEDAPEGVIRIKLEATKAGQPVSVTNDIDWRITRQGVIRAVLC
ncbi:MAG TPA: hypothetical protein VI815_03455 [Candidatus Nanoarchaeia archaeon]|nr:hypothetical protein [Candidatus Nanoarchaeia archaeon]